MGRIKREWEHQDEQAVEAAFAVFRQEHPDAALTADTLRAFMKSPQYVGKHTLIELESLLIGRDDR